VPEIRRALDDPHPPLATEPLTAQVDALPGSLTPARSATVADADPPRSARTRLCVLCGGPLRAGQRVTRVQGSRIHTSCGGDGR
jgi:hypothetical protein